MGTKQPRSGPTLQDIARAFVRKLTDTLAGNDPAKEQALQENEAKREAEVTKALEAHMAKKKRPNERRPLFAVLPGVGIGPFRLGMTEEEIDALCRQFGLRNENCFASGLHVGFHEGRATQISIAVDIGLSLADEPVSEGFNENVKRLLAKIAAPGPDWTEMEGLRVCHWDSRSEPVFAFMVYAPGYRFQPPSDPEVERKELEAQREKEERMRAALMGQGLIKKGGGK